MIRGRSRAHLDKAVDAIGALLPAFERVGFAEPEARSAVETTGEDRLPRSTPFRAIGDAQPLTCPCAFQELFTKRHSVTAFWDIDLDALQEAFCVLLMPRRDQDVHLSKQ